MTRRQLYNEIWEISVAGVAKKYDLSYGLFLKLCKEVDIPIPPSGYWIKIRFSKPVVKMPLPDSGIDMVTLSDQEVPRAPKKEAAEEKQPLIKNIADISASAAVVVAQKPENVQTPIISDSEPKLPSAVQDTAEEKQLTESVETYTQWGQTYNIYRRETLYK